MSFTIRQFKGRFVRFSITMKGFLGGLTTNITKNKRMNNRLITLLLISPFLFASCDSQDRKSESESSKGSPILSSQLDRKVYTEEYIKETIKVGLPAKDVQSLVGKPNSVRNIMDQTHWSYLLSPPTSKGLHVIEFVVVFENEVVDEVKMTWLGF